MTVFSVYSSRTLYHLVMRALYGRSFESRYRVIAARIPEQASVVDVCAGDGLLYVRYLRPKGVRYLGMDASPALVRWAKRYGAPVELVDVRSTAIAAADYVVMQSSLYQFLPFAREMLDRVVAAARVAALVTEPIVNVSASRRRWLAKISRRLTAPPGSKESAARRFDRRSLDELFRSHPAFETAEMVPGDREMLGVFRGGGSA